MAKIPRKLKRQVKRDVKSYGNTEKIKKAQTVYAFSPGDLVMYNGYQGLIIKEDDRGYYLIMTSNGQEWGKGSRIRKIRDI